MPGVTEMILSAAGGLVWLIRLEGRINANAKLLEILQKDIDTLRGKHETLDTQTVKELSRIREALARIEGHLRREESYKP